MKHIVHASIAVAAALLLVSPALAAMKVGDSPKYSFQTLDGKTVSNESLKGKLVLIDFWATWCGPCMAEAGHMVATHQKYGEKGLQIVGVSLDRDRDALVNGIKGANFTWPQFHDARGLTAQAWGVNGIPQTFLISPEGTVIWEGHPAQMDKPIENAFRNSPPKLVDAEAVADATAALDQAEAALTSGDTGAAMKAMATLPASARADATVKPRVDKALAQLTPAADASITEAEQLIGKKQFADAAAKLSDVAKGLPGTPAGAKAKAKLDELSKMPEVKAELAKAEGVAKAAEELAVAQQLKSDGKDEQAYVKFKAVARAAPDSDAGKSAAAAAAEYEKDPAFVKRANEANAGGKAKGMIGLAQSYKRSGKPELAKKKYQEVIDQFPDTSYAETAKKELAAI